jgi:hypothetical protein
MKILCTAILVSFSFISSYSQTVIYEENFDYFLWGTLLGGATPEWETWTGTYDDDPLVKPGISLSPDNSVNFTTLDDIYYNFNNVTSGRYKIGFSMYCMQGTGVYLNVEHDFKSNYAFELWFDGQNRVRFKNGTDSLQLATYTFEQWHRIEMEIDLDLDNVKVLLDSIDIGQFQFSLSVLDTPLNQLGIIDFYGMTNVISGYDIPYTQWYMDDFRVEKLLPNSINQVQKGVVLLYPNPCKGKAIIELPNLKQIEMIQLVNNVGGIISEFVNISESTFELKLPKPSGLYHIIVYHKDGSSQSYHLVNEGWN